mmetsp:Transcript_148323/g.474754  ORF Transcript_148323/g.474754 Transcript_148323/m.474754 type:complete len:188 (-) Transcript_148323:505-1068(-)
MGLALAKLWKQLFGQLEVRIVMVGLDSAGKTTILYKLKLGEVVTTVPTIGFNVETVEYRNIHFTVWDVGGQSRIRPLWRHYYEGTDGIVFVVDCGDRERIGDARSELDKMLKEEQLQGAALLVLANKQDLPNVMLASEAAIPMRGRGARLPTTSASARSRAGSGMYRRRVRLAGRASTRGWIGSRAH